MFRLANRKFRENKELEKLATECLTKTIKSHLESYFFVGYENEKEDTLYKMVDLEEAIYLLPDELWDEMEESEIDECLFLKKKIAEFMNILNSKESITPDIFIEYLLYRMIVTTDEWFYEIPEEVQKYKSLLLEPLDEYALDYAYSYVDCYELEDGTVKYQNSFGEDITKEEYEEILKDSKEEYIEKVINNLTNIPAMSMDEDSLVFWDWDFKFFDNWGFEATLKNISSGPIALMTGYGEEYVKNMLDGTGAEIPNFLNSVF